MPIFLVVMLVASVAFTIKTNIDNTVSYNAALAEARDLAGKGIEADAIDKYKEVLAIRPTLDVMLEAGEVYLEHEDYTQAKKWYTKQLLEEYPKEADTYLYGIRLYLAQDRYRYAYEVYDNYQGRGLYSEAVEAAMDEVRYMYTVSGLYEDAGTFSNSTNTAAAKYGDMWGYVDTAGNKKIGYQFEEADVFGTSLAAIIDKDGNPGYIDADGNVKINGNFILDENPDFGKVTEFKPIQSNLILACNGKEWAYFSAETYEYLFGGFKDAYPITLGVGAVSNGSKWALISSDGTLITDYKFDEVLADNKQVVCRTDALVVSEAGKYYLVNKQGKKISDTFAKGCAFYDTAYAAMGNGNKWSFVDASGNVVFTTQAQEARSFSGGLAAVRLSGKWGFIDTNGKVAIEAVFEDVGSFNTTGVTFIQKSDGFWQLLSLYSFNH